MARKPADTKPASAADTNAASESSEPGSSEPERLRQGNAPPCPYCSKEGKPPVMCVSQRSDPYFTRYYCPTEGCNFAVKVPRPQLRDRLRRAQEDEKDFSAR